VSERDPEVTQLLAFAEEYRKKSTGGALRAWNRKSFRTLEERLSQLVRQGQLSEIDFRTFQFILSQTKALGPEMDAHHLLKHQLKEAEKAYRNTDLSFQGRLSRVARKLGWIAPHRRGRKYPDSTATEFEMLTKESGTVGLKRLPTDPLAETYIGMKVENCPLEPRDAIELLAKRYDFPGYKHCLQFLRRQRIRLDKHRRALSSHIYAPRVRTYLASLPTLDNLPCGRKR